MALSALIQAIQARFRGTNNNAYNASSNPLGLGQGGHRQNFPPRLKDMADSLDWVAGAMDAVDADATATAADRVQTGKDVIATAASATNAATSATAAETSRIAASDLLDSFDDRYLGTKSVDPTKDNDGNSLVAGTIFFSTSANVMKVWTGSVWQVFIPGAADYLLKSGGTMTGLIAFLAGQFASQAEAEAGTDTSKLMTPQRVAQAIAKLVAPAKFESALVHVREEYAAGTGGGTPTANAWTARTLNTLRNNEIGASLSASVLTLPAGTYFVEASAPTINAGAHQVRLWNVSDSAVVINGTSEANTNAGVQTRSHLSGRFTLTASKQVRLEHYVTTVGSAASTLGSSTNAVGAGPAIYSDMKIWKVA